MITYSEKTIAVTRPRFALRIRLITFGREAFGDIPRGVILEIAMATAVPNTPIK